MTYCERRYFCVYKFSQIGENKQFRGDLTFLTILPLNGIIKVFFTLNIFSQTF